MPRQTKLSVVPDAPMSGVEPSLYYQVPNWAAIKAIRAKLTSADWCVWSYLQMLDPYDDRAKDLANSEKISKAIDISEKQVKRSLKRLKEIELLPNWVVLSSAEKNSVEFQIRDRLFRELGGLTEVKTPSGRIDLLTEAEIIEVKRVNDWKAALGQILVYSGFYPEHQKRLHLFGSAKDEKAIADIAATCLVFDVMVSFEVVGDK